MAHTTRRTVLAAIATAATPLPALALAAPQDPIFAAIEAHAAATMHMLRTGTVACSMLGTDPGYAEAAAANEAADDAWHATTDALVSTRPTTRAGLVALLAYVTRFDIGQLTLGGGHYSDVMLWPTEMTDEDTSLTNGRGNPLILPFAHWLIRTVHEALTNGAA